MFGRFFGRNKDEPEAAVCAKCGRTLLAGEWTRRVLDADSEERLVCSLCGPELPLDQDEPPEATWGAGDGEQGHDEPVAGAEEVEGADPVVVEAPAAASDEVEEKDLEIASLLERLAQAEKLNAELRSEIEGLRAAASTAGADEQTIDSSEPGEVTWGETPAEFAAELQAQAPADDAETSDTEAEPGGDSGPALGDTQPMAAVVAASTTPEQTVAEAAADIATAAAVDEEPEAAADEGAPGDGRQSGDGDELSDAEPAATGEPEEPEDVEPVAEEVEEAEEQGEPECEPPTEAEVAALAQLQRGVDLFNVSRVPRKIAETNEQLGTPVVHADPEEGLVAVTFAWSMGWYRFHVDTESGEVKLADRGYDEITDLSPNAGVRPDGTVHLAPARISRAVAQKATQNGDTSDLVKEDVADIAGEPESPSAAAQKPPEILSKSLLGQRSDDESAGWEKKKPREFDWDR